MQLTVKLLFHTLCQFCFTVLCFTKTSAAEDMLTQNQLINDSSSLVSSGNKFKLGFFVPGNSNYRYLGIWYNYIPVPTVVWVANRNSLLDDSSGILKIANDGNLILVNQAGRIAWSTNIPNISSKATVAQLLDSGNLVLKYESDADSDQNYLWQSFDHPTDTLLPGMKLGWDFRVGLNRYLTSWKGIDDPSPGEFSHGIDPGIFPQMILRKGSVKQYRAGIYDFDTRLNGTWMKPNPFFSLKFVSNQQELYYEYNLYSDLTIFFLSYTGTIHRLVWDNKSLAWFDMVVHPSDPCDNHNRCGANAICTISNIPPCTCLAGYMPKSSEGKNMLLSSDGCIRKHPLNCPENEGFIKVNGVKVPDVWQFQMYPNMTLEECQKECLKNCSCTAYTIQDSSEGDSACLLWDGDLLDTRRHAFYNHISLFVRVTAADLESLSISTKKKPLVMIIITVPVTFALLIGALYVLWRKQIHTEEILANYEEKLELPVFDIATIQEATKNFSSSSKIGEGGFGSVYKGQLPSGQEIAVKRLSENSRQGLHQFENEVIVIAKLQHRNLVRLLGCCTSKVERMLIFEYMPNGSLDSLIFGRPGCDRVSLVWRRRFDIIVGIARGILYLHRDSRLRIIHRDLKASNVLLDSEMNPKISDFGIARVVPGDQLSGKTRVVVGTYGYMPPEYVIGGFFSEKSDIFSFGVLILEIVSGRRNKRFDYLDHEVSLLGYAWKLWTEGNISELIDEQMEYSFPMSEVVRCIQVGLLCVQRSPEDRPSMSSVLLMLDTETITLPQPKQPGFYVDKSPKETEREKFTTNAITITDMECR